MDMKKDSSAAGAERDLSPPPPYPADVTSQTLSLDYSNWRSGIVVTDSAKRVLFASHGSSMSADLEVTDRDDRTIGRSHRDVLRSKITVEMSSAPGAGQQFEVHKSAGALGGTPRYTSPAFEGQELAWKSKALSRSIIYTLVDQNDVTLADFKSDPKTETGRLEIADAVTGAKLEEVVVILLTLLRRKLKNIHASEYEPAAV